MYFCVRPILVLFVSVFFLVGSLQAKEDKSVIYKKLETLSKVLSYVETNYIEEKEMSDLLDDAIKGVVSGLDPHTAYMPPKLYKDMQEDTSGRYFGVGMEVSMKDGELTVITPMDGSPAEEAGVLPGDKILKINGKNAKGLGLLEAVELIKGPEGSDVVFHILRPATDETKDYSMKRRRIRVQSVSAKLLENEFGYIKIKSFREQTDKEFVDALAKLNVKLNQGLEKGKKAKLLKGLVLDLRNNPGGLLGQAVRISDLFLKEGVIVSTKGKNGSFEETSMAKNDGNEPDYPMITLVNGGSASASEIVAGALQDHQRSVVLGLTTFGKGSVQSLIDLKDGSALKLTIARYYTPNGRSIQAKGIIPDIQISHLPAEKEASAIREKDLQKHIENPAAEAKRKKGKRKNTDVVQEKDEDIQLSRALDYLKSWYVFGGREA